MVFVFTFAVGGGSGTVINMPNWALVRLEPYWHELMKLTCNLESERKSRLLSTTYVKYALQVRST